MKKAGYGFGVTVQEPDKVLHTIQQDSSQTQHPPAKTKQHGASAPTGENMKFVRNHLIPNTIAFAIGCGLCLIYLIGTGDI